MGKVIVVDDTEVTREQIRKLLVDAGHEVISAVNGIDGLAKASENSGVGLVITDYNMPEMDGLTMLRQIRTLPAHAETTFFMLTTESSPGLKSLGRECGIRAWIIKPCAPKSILAAVQMIFGAN